MIVAAKAWIHLDPNARRQVGRPVRTPLSKPCLRLRMCDWRKDGHHIEAIVLTNVWDRPIADIGCFSEKDVMRTRACFAVSVILCATAGCSTTSETTRCSATSLQQVIDNPVQYSGRRFCGEALVAQPERVTRIMRTADEINAYGTVVLATTATRRLLGEVRMQPTSYYIEARIDPQAECFGPSESGEQCLPFARPVMFHITRARRLVNDR